MTALTAWSTVPEDQAADLDELSDALIEVCCSCVHRFEHPLEVQRVRDTGTVLGFRLGPCPVPYCGCRGGRS